MGLLSVLSAQSTSSACRSWPQQVTGRSLGCTLNWLVKDTSKLEVGSGEVRSGKRHDIAGSSVVQVLKVPSYASRSSLTAWNSREEADNIKANHHVLLFHIDCFQLCDEVLGVSDIGGCRMLARCLASL